MSELTKAHIKFLKEIGTITKSETNDFHNSKYASLEGVLSVVIPVLIKNDLSVFWTYSHEGGLTILNTHLRHASGEAAPISSTPYPELTGKNKLHEWGKTNTYLRRFTLLSILGICAGIEDNDGNHAVVLTEEKVTPNPDRRIQIDEKKEALAVLKDWCSKNNLKAEQLKKDFSTEFLGGAGLDAKSFWNTHLLFEKHVQYLNGYIK